MILKTRNSGKAYRNSGIPITTVCVEPLLTLVLASENVAKFLSKTLLIKSNYFLHYNLADCEGIIQLLCNPIKNKARDF
jgi:hypothetical protein